MSLSRFAAAIAIVFGVVAAVPAARAWTWDQNHNRIDDRIEAVESNGINAAHVGNTLGGKLILFVDSSALPFRYGVYVGYDHRPTDADVAALRNAGATLTWRPRYIQYLRAQATYAEIQALVALPGVTRVEAWQVMYATNDNATRTLRARDAAGGVGSGMFPSVWKDLGVTGRGVVVGILDTGVNDDVMGPYPGHESLLGKFVGGGDFSNPDASLNTSPDSSANPANHVDPEGSYHATHVAGTAIGSGGPLGVLAPGTVPGPYAGMAPDARLADCKVLTDAGEGGGSAEALEWCIAHRNTVWATDATGATYRGVQVINMSLGGATASDGTDADCAAVNAAVKAGIVVCVATGNDGNTHYMPSPAAADLDVSVGALQDANTLPHADDIVADYSNEGPRMDDGDSDHLDEMKPTICGSGSDIVSALGDPSTNGRRYHNINGTSMATPTIAGLCALIRQANPNLSPLEVRDILENTAEHRTDHGKQAAAQADSFHIDPNYHPSWGWGEPDAYAAVKEAVSSATTQVVSEGATPALLGGVLQVQLRWSTQREVGVSSFAVARAQDLGGYAGDFVVVSPPIAPTGHPVIERSGNRTAYAWTDNDVALVPGTPYWYQVRWTDGDGFAHVEPAFRVLTDTPPVRARVQWAITHNAIDNDIFARFGSGTDPNAAALVRPCGGSPAADSMKVVVPIGFGSMTRYFFHADLTDRDQVGDFLPPGAANPWFLSVLEKGYVNTEGFVDSFSVTVYDGANSTVYHAPNPTTPTSEGQTTTFWIPLDPATSLNHHPVLDPIGDRTVGEGLTMNLQTHATDSDGQAITYAAGPLPPGATFDVATRTFDWSPGFGQAGAYGITFHATDTMGAADSEHITISVYARAPGSNTAPVLAPITDKSVPVNGTMTFTATAHDAEGGPLAFSATGLPAGASIQPSSGAFSWTPAPGEEGVYHVTFRVSDPSAAADSQAVTLGATPVVAAISGDCHPDTTRFSGTIGANVQGLQDVSTYHAFNVHANVMAIQGFLDWTGGPAIDLDLYLLDPSGNAVGSGATATSDPEHLAYERPAPGLYQWKVSSYDNPNPSLAYTVTSVLCTSATVGVVTGSGPGTIDLAQNFPNPFSRTSVIRFAVPRAQQVSLKIYDPAGRRLRTLVDGQVQPGWFQRVWDGRDDGGRRVASGVYFYRLDTQDGARTRRMVVLQ